MARMQWPGPWLPASSPPADTLDEGRDESNCPAERRPTLSNVAQSPSSYNPLRARDLNRERVAVYCRVSSDEQAQAGTIQNQIEFARRYCELHELPIAAIYADEGVSGTVPMPERPEGKRMLDDARAAR